MDNQFIRNFCIISHVDHGKSTLADRFLELTQTVPKEKMKPQYLDQMPLERERGVTIKLTPVTMSYLLNSQLYILNLIDTPGHIDFSYEVSRALAAVEGAILLVDASQGIQAQTITNLKLALVQKLVIIPVLNKIDLPALDLTTRKKELASLLKISTEEILLISAKTGQGVEKVLRKVVEKIPPPGGQPAAPLRALVFDSLYSEHRGVIVYLKVVDGELKSGDKLEMLGSKAKFEALEVGVFKPFLTKKESLPHGSIGYLVTGLKEIRKCRVGETITLQKAKDKIQPLPGYQEIKPMVFSSLYLQPGQEPGKLGEALEKLKLNDASLFFEPEKSSSLGLGYRGGFLGLFHLEIVKERLKREYNLEVITSRPSVAYHVWLRGKREFQEIYSPEKFPTGNIEKVEEPIMKVEIITPEKYLGSILALIKKYHGEFTSYDYLSTDSLLDNFNSLMIKAKIPLAMLMVDFYDQLKNVSAGFASMSYEFAGYQEADLVRLDILLAGERQEAFSSIVYRQEAYSEARKIVDFLKKNLPRQMFEVKIQAVLGWQPKAKGREAGGKIIASERLPALRKDVTAKLYGGDITRKMKLLQKQKRGKEKLRRFGRVEIPSDLYLKMLKR
ncbi:MAG: translation elongation factor 4 [Patescibacteria group bacterium]|nr:translation elongation factor 4 [Patescibacteria group bacterium]